MQRIAPLEYADKSWDNVGTLLESPSKVTTSGAAGAGGKILLTIDLTPAVAAEAVSEKVNVIVAYHPFIFSGLKSITLRDPKQLALMQLVQSEISVYCPHSALDAVSGGLNDWLCSIVDGATATTSSNTSAPCYAPTRCPIIPAENNPSIGVGRYSTAKTNLADVIAAVKAGTNTPHLRVAVPDELRHKSPSEIKIESYAVCAGSGATVFRGLRGPMSRPDLLLAGELDHHTVLAWIQKGTCVVLCEHTNSERGYLAAELKSRLGRELGAGDGVEILVSKVDADPMRMM
jgi:dinuclear metal center YbgI/SA1388 family protein